MLNKMRDTPTAYRDGVAEKQAAGIAGNVGDNTRVCFEHMAGDGRKTAASLAEQVPFSVIRCLK